MADMQPGDIIIFEAGDNWLSKCIAKLTNSTVSHAALRYSGDDMVEMSSGGIRQSGCYESDNGGQAYLLRLSPAKDTDPIIAAAKRYLDADTRYDFPDLIFFGGLLIYRAIRPTQRWQKITDLILNAACALLDKLLNKIISKGSSSPAMVCSQLVYQCYLDCGEGYEIILKDALLQNSADQADSSSGKIRLADMLGASDEDMVQASYGETSDDFDLENAARELYSAMEDAESGQEDLVSSSNLKSTLSAAQRFLDLVEEILEKTDANIPVPALFVAPSDLLNHAENLEQYATAKISREQAQ